MRQVSPVSTPSRPVSSRRSRIGLGIVLGLTASASFATSGPFARPLLEAGWTPGAAVFWRVAIASAALLPFGLVALRRQWSALRSDWPLVLAFGALAVATPQLFFFAAVDRMSVAIALLIEYMAPVLLVCLAWIRTRSAPPALVLSGAAVSVLGLICVLDLAGATPDLLGTGFALVAMVGAAAYFALAARPTRLPSLALASFGLMVGAVVLAAAILVGVLPYSAPLVEVVLLGQLVAWWLPLLVVSLVAAALAYSLGIAGIAGMGERLASFVSLSEVLFAAVLSAVLLGEVPTAVQVVGGILIVAGVIAIRLSANSATVDLDRTATTP